MTKRYNLANIRTMLTEGFTVAELRRLCYDEFKPVYHKLGPDTGKTEIIDLLVEYGEQKLRIDGLLAWAKKHNPARYDEHQPYYEAAISSNDHGKPDMLHQAKPRRQNSGRPGWLGATVGVTLILLACLVGLSMPFAWGFLVGTPTPITTEVVALSPTPTEVPGPTDTLLPPTTTPIPTLPPPTEILVPTDIPILPTATPTPTVTPTPTETPNNTPTPTETPSDTSTTESETIEFTSSANTIQGGECVTMRWNATGMKEIYYNNEGGASSGERIECPNDTQTYYLRVVRQDNSQVTNELTVEVVNRVKSKGTLTVDSGQTVDFDDGDIPGDDFYWFVDNRTRRFEVLAGVLLAPQNQYVSLDYVSRSDCDNADYNSYTYIDGSDDALEGLNELGDGRTACYRTKEGRLGKLRFPEYSSGPIKIEWLTWKD